MRLKIHWIVLLVIVASVLYEWRKNHRLLPIIMQIIAFEKFQIQNLVMKCLCEILEVPAYY